jgi:hypothetical protein
VSDRGYSLIELKNGSEYMAKNPTPTQGQAPSSSLRIVGNVTCVSTESSRVFNSIQSLPGISSIEVKKNEGSRSRGKNSRSSLMIGTSQSGKSIVVTVTAKNSKQDILIGVQDVLTQSQADGTPASVDKAATLKRRNELMSSIQKLGDDMRCFNKVLKRVAA